MAMLVLPTEIDCATAPPVVLICRITSPSRDGTPGSPVFASIVTRSTPAMPFGAKTKPPCPSSRPTPSTVTVTSETPMRIIFGAGSGPAASGSASVICSKAKLPLSTNGAELPSPMSTVTRQRARQAQERPLRHASGWS